MPKCAATSYAVVAHSAGGYCFENLWARHRDELVKKLGCLVFTDSSYSAMLKNLTSTEVRLLKRIGRHLTQVNNLKQRIGQFLGNIRN